MEALLAEIRSSMSRPPQQRSLSLSATPVPASSEAPRTIGHQEDMLLAVDGPSSLMAQIAMAKHLAENTIRPGHSGPSDSRMSEAIRSLGQVVDSNASQAPPETPASSREIPLPLVGAIREGLRILQGK